jgi:hypothetical protein
MWTKIIDHTLYYSIQRDSKLLKASIYTMPLISLILASFLSQSPRIAFALMLLNFILNANLLSLPLPLSLFLYVLLSRPLPSKTYIKTLLTYLLTIVTLKVLYQLPLFCSSPSYTLFSLDRCNPAVIPPEILFKRNDYIIGLRKFSGPASYPKD